MGYIGICDTKGYGFSAVLVTLVFNSVFLEEATSSSRVPSLIRALPSSTPFNACYAG